MPESFETDNEMVSPPIQMNIPKNIVRLKFDRKYITFFDIALFL